MPNSPHGRCDRSTSTIILDLNDHVLRETFEYLNDFELCTVADVFSTFRRNAQAVFSLRYKQKRLTITVWYYFNMLSTYLRPAYFILRNFGPFINSLNLQLFGADAHQSRSFFEIFVQFCGKTLNELQLCAITFTKDHIPIMEPLLRRLQKMTLDKCQFDAGFDASRMFSLCAELHAVSFTGIPSPGNWIFPINVNIPNLKSLRIFYMISENISIDNKSLRKFLEVNPQLKEIEIDKCYSVSNENLQSIIKYAPQIEKLKILIYIHDWVELARHLKQLGALQWFDASCRGHSFTSIINELAASHIPLKCLCLDSFFGDEGLFDGISKLKQLRTLVFGKGKGMELSDILKMIECLSDLSDLRFWSGQVTASHYLKIVQCAPKLQYLQIKSYDSRNREIIFDISLYKKILEVVANRNEPMIRLDIKLQRDSLKVPQTILNANRKWLKIDTAYEDTPIRYAT